MLSFGTVLNRHRGIGPGFDFLRIGLAVSILWVHAFMTTGHYHRSSPIWFTQYTFVPMFFALSGFLITGSAARLSLKNFLINRSLRIVPALAIDVVVCTLIIGPIVTTMALSGYFHDGRFYRYFLNIMGWIHYFLPGVFATNPTNMVNGALWTVPHEIFCYAIVSFFIISKWVRKPAYVIAFTLFYMIFGLISQVFVSQQSLGIGENHLYAFLDQGSQLTTAFLFGIIVYHFRDKIPYSWPLFGLACTICLGAVFYLNDDDILRIGNALSFFQPWSTLRFF